MRDLLGGKGAGVAEMTRAGLPVPPGFTITTAGVQRLLRGGPAFPGRHVGAGAARTQGDRTQDGQAIRRPGQPAAGQRAQRGQVLHAGHDGHRPQPRPQRARRSRASPRSPATSASPRTPTAGSSSCSARSCSASTATSSSTSSTRSRRKAACQERRRPQAGGARRGHRALPQAGAQARRRRVPRGSDGTAARGDRCGVLVVEQQARHRLPQLQQDPAHAGHRGQRAVDGVRQHGRRLRAPVWRSRAIPPPASTCCTAST